MKLALRLAIDVLVILVIGSAFTVNASARSLPGDPTYRVKRTWEQVRLGLTTNEQARQQLESQFSEERREEIQALLQLGRQVRVTYTGILEQMEGDQWTVGGLTFEMADDTTIEGEPGIGRLVKILAHVQNNGTLLALHVSLGVYPGLAPGDPLPYPGPGATATPQPIQPSHTPDHTAGPLHTSTPEHTAGPSGTASSTHPVEPDHDAGEGHSTEQPHHDEPTQHNKQPRETDPSHHDEPPHEQEPHGGHH